MTTIVAVQKDGVAALAADSLSVWGSAKESSGYVAGNEKIIEVGNSCLAICGPTSAKLVLKHYFSSRRDVDLTGVDAIFAAWLELHAALRKQYFLEPHEHEDDSFESTRIEVLIANPAGIFGVARHRAIQQDSKFCAYGSGGEYALGAMYALYSQPDLSAEHIARTAVAAAAEFDINTGLPAICRVVNCRSG